LPLAYHHSHFLAATLDFTSFFTMTLMGPHTFFTAGLFWIRFTILEFIELFVSVVVFLTKLCVLLAQIVLFASSRHMVVCRAAQEATSECWLLGPGRTKRTQFLHIRSSVILNETKWFLQWKCRPMSSPHISNLNWITLGVSKIWTFKNWLSFLFFSSFCQRVKVVIKH